jgi:hypothetical protein
MGIATLIGMRLYYAIFTSFANSSGVANKWEGYIDPPDTPEAPTLGAVCFRFSESM